MNVFIVGTPLETAKALDKRRLNKQIIECRQILKALNGETTAWANHPCTLQYKGCEIWLRYYMLTLHYFDIENEEEAEMADEEAQKLTPAFHTQEYFEQMKRRLFTKDSKLYPQWAYLGTSEENWYCVEGEWRIYKDGKRVNI